MTDDSNLLDALVAQVEDETLRSRLSREIELLRGSRRFGLVFDRHLPESVRLPREGRGGAVRNLKPFRVRRDWERLRSFRA